MELNESQLRYLMTVYELGRAAPEVGATDIAEALGVTKPSVSRMIGVLMEKGLLVRERYSKIYLTDTGFLLAKELQRKLESVKARLPALGLEMTEAERKSAACALVALFQRKPPAWFGVEQYKVLEVRSEPFEKKGPFGR